MGKLNYTQSSEYCVGFFISINFVCLLNISAVSVLFFLPRVIKLKSVNAKSISEVVELKCTSFDWSVQLDIRKQCKAKELTVPCSLAAGRLLNRLKSVVRVTIILLVFFFLQCLKYFVYYVSFSRV